jgi:hypothetical protein
VWGRGRRDPERGAALVETAIVAPLFFLMIFGVMETGWAFFNRGTADNMSVVGARTGSSQADEALADYRILQAVKGGASGLATSQVRLVVVYRATSPTDRVPSACKTASVTNTSTTRGCNRYVGANLTLASDQFGCFGPPGPTQKLDRFWCPTARKSALSGSNGPPDYIGVYVETAGKTLVGIISNAFTFSADTVIRIEPRTAT